MVRAFRFSSFVFLTASLVAMASTPLHALCPDFNPPSGISTGTGPAGIATGDFNHDGRPDVAVTNSTADNVSILLGDGSGAFTPAPLVTAGAAPVALATADFNGDARLDLAIVNSGDASVTVVFGNGFGDFHSPASYAVGSGARAIVAADFNLDGAPDLAIVNANANTFSVFVGSSFGTFSSAGLHIAETNPRDLVAADFNGDGLPDLAIANRDSKNVSVHPGLGNGSFGPMSTFPVPPLLVAYALPSSIAAGDFDRNGTVDLAVASTFSNSVAVLSGNGAGSFATSGLIAVGNLPSSIKASDVTLDGALDLLVASLDGEITLVAGDGAGGFGPQLSYSAGDEPVALAVTDIDGDAKPDLLAADLTGNQLALRLNSGSCFANCATFAAHAPFGLGGTGSAVVTGDFDNDGMTDFVIADEAANTIALQLGDGVGGFTGPTTLSTGTSPGALAAADINRDGNLDLAAVNFGSDSISIYLGDGAGSFGFPSSDVSLASGTGPRGITTGDFDRNGTMDFAVTGGTAKTLEILINATSRGSSSPSFSTSTITSVGSGQGPRGIVSGDFNRDGAVDLVVANFGDGATAGSVLLYPGNGSAGFSPAGSVTAERGTAAVELRDFDGDGDLDVAAANSGDGNVTISLGDGSGSFGSGSTVAAGANPKSVVAVDVNLDGVLDLATANSGGSDVSILLGNGTGGFSAASPPAEAVGVSPAALASGDFNRDGKPDLIAATANSSGIASVILNACPPPDLSITKTHSGTFEQGGTGTYFITVSNLATVASAGNVTVIDTLPAGLTATGINGLNWDCTLSPLQCSRSDSLAGNDSWPSINVTVGIATNAPPTVTNVATVNGGADVSANNNTASDQTTITQRPDLVISKTHAGDFSQGQNGATYTITVNNAGGAASIGFVSVVDTLPAGLTATAMSGTGWTCTLASLTCTRSDAVASGGSFPAITLTVDVSPTASSPLTNVATVSGGSDGFSSNNTASDPTIVTPRADLTIAKSHSGSFSQGQSGAIYTIVVENIGGAATTGTVTVVDTLPTGLTATAMSGSGWTCTLGTVSCTRDNALASGGSYPAITLTVSVAADATTPLVNSVTVSGGGEVGTLNSSDTDSTVIKRIVPSCGRFAPQTTLPSVGNGTPRAVTMADFNGDGDLDVAYTTEAADILAVMLGNGDGTFDAPVTLATGSSPNAPITGDFDSDGALDIALVSTGSNNVSVYLGNGNGTFAGAVDYSVGSFPYTVTSGYFNADAHLDLAVTNSQSANVSVLLGSAAGAFAPAVSYATATGPMAVKSGDFDEDGKTDLAVAASHGLSVLLGAGDGTFAAPVHYFLGSDPRAIVVEDFDNDGTQDLAVAHLGSKTVSVLIGTGDGTFGAKTDFATPLGTFWVESDDFDGDGNADLAVPHNSGVAVLFGSGTGSFAAGVTEATGTGTLGVATGDINGDARPDMFAVNGTSKTLSIVLNGCTDLRVAKTHSGNFTQGQTGATYSIVVSNADLIEGSGTVTVTDTLPFGLTATAISGSGWSCTLATLTCTRAALLAPGASLPAITVTVNVHSNAPATITNTATVAGSADDLPGNNTASDQTTVIAASMIAPTRLIAIAQSTSHIYLAWDGVTDAVTYKIFRRSLGAPFAQIANVATGPFTDFGLSSGVTYVYQVRAVNSAAVSGPPSINDLATTSFFTDATLSPAIKAVHFTELRTAINAVRAAAGLGAASYTNAIAPGGIIKAIDLNEMRSALNTARTALAVPAVTYTDPSLVAGTQIKAAHVQDLRLGTQ